MKQIFFLFCLLLLAFGSFGQSKSKALEFFEQGQIAQQNGEHREALSLFDQSIAIDPALQDAFLARAVSKEELKDYHGALIDYSIFLEKSPQHYEARLASANVKYKLGKYEEAKEGYMKLLDLPAGETTTVMFQKSASASGTMQITTAQSDLKSTLFNYIGLTELKLNQYDAAIHWLDSAIQRNPREADYYVNRGMAREAIDKDRAEEDYKQALRINPNHTMALHNLGVLKKNDSTRSAADYIDRAIESDSTMLTPYLERGYQRMQSGFWKGALEDYDHAIEIEENDPEIYLNRGYVREKLNDLKGAYSDYTKAIALDEKYEKAWLNRGNLLGKMGKYKEAVEDYSVALTFDADYGAAYYNRAVAKEKLKLYSEACEDIRKAEALGVNVDKKLKSSVCK